MAKATFPAQSQAVAESVKPADGDGFTPGDHRNAYSSLYQGDLSPLRPRAKAPATPLINIAPAEIENFYRQIYWNSGHVQFAGGDSPAFPAPASNPRIDLLVLDVSGGPTGVLTRIAGTEAASPAEPALPDLRTNIPLCYVYNRAGQTKIVNAEDSGASPTEGYLYRDVRPWVPPGGGTSFGVAPGSSAIGDTATEGTNPAAARGDHRHGREAAGTPVTQAFGDAAGAGSATTVARSDHRHGMPAAPITQGLKRLGTINLNGASSGTLSGLDGDTDRIYLIVIQGRWIPGGADDNMSIRPNSATSNMRCYLKREGDETTGPTLISDNGLIVGRSSSLGNQRVDYMIECWLNARKTGQGDQEARSYMAIGGHGRGSGGNTTVFCWCAGRWMEVATNITSLQFFLSAGTFTGDVDIYARL